MIICLCHNVNTQTIKSSVEAGASTLDMIKSDTKAGSCCGKCQFKVNVALNETLTELNSNAETRLSL